jgi:hypothetical protein
MSPSRSNRRGGCNGGCCCLVLFLLLLAGAALVFVVGFNGLQRIGLRKPASLEVFSDAPDLDAAQALLADYQKTGLNTKGLGLYVLPYAGTQASAAVAVLDMSKGFALPSSDDADAIFSYLKTLAASKVLDQYGVNRIGLLYRDQKGEPLLTVTAPLASIRSYASGKLSREDFVHSVNMDADLVKLYSEVQQ